MQWSDIKYDKEKMAELLNNNSARELGRKFGIDHKTVTRWVKSEFDFKYENGEWITKKYNGSPEVIEKEDHYLVVDKNRVLKITEDQLQEIKRLYCGRDYLDIKSLLRELEMNRDDFQLIKNAFDIVHNDIPHTEKEIENNEIETLVEDDIQKEKKKYFTKLRQKEIDKMKRELKEYRKDEYYLNKAIEDMKDDLWDIDYHRPKLRINEVNQDNELLVTCSDWHTGKKVEAKKLIGESNSFNQEIYQQRINKFTKKVLKTIENKKPNKIYIVNTGDALDGATGGVYEGQRDNQDVNDEEQVIAYQKAFMDFRIHVNSYTFMLYFYHSPSQACSDSSEKLCCGIEPRYLFEVLHHLHCGSQELLLKQLKTHRFCILSSYDNLLFL